VVWFHRQNSPVKRLRIRQKSGLVILERVLKGLLGRHRR